jgi:hypothetical protein
MLGLGLGFGPCMLKALSYLSNLRFVRDFADKYPSAQVAGTDLSAIQPQWVPPNCKFELDDAQLEWKYPPNHFDFVQC